MSKYPYALTVACFYHHANENGQNPDLKTIQARALFCGAELDKARGLFERGDIDRFIETMPRVTSQVFEENAKGITIEKEPYAIQLREMYCEIASEVTGMIYLDAMYGWNARDGLIIHTRDGRQKNCTTSQRHERVMKKQANGLYVEVERAGPERMFEITKPDPLSWVWAHTFSDPKLN